jgi:heme A synthase
VGVEVEDAGHIIKWVWASALFAYLTAQVVAVRRLTGERKRRSRSVLIAMLICIMLDSVVRDVFENREAGRIAALALAVAAIIATLVLVRMLRTQSGVKVTAAEDDGEDRIQTLKLN